MIEVFKIMKGIDDVDFRTFFAPVNTELRGLRT